MTTTSATAARAAGVLALAVAAAAGPIGREAVAATVDPTRRVVVMHTGRRLEVTHATPRGDWMRLDLPGGGFIQVPLSSVKRVSQGADALAQASPLLLSRGGGGAAGTSIPGEAPRAHVVDSPEMFDLGASIHRASADVAGLDGRTPGGILGEPGRPTMLDVMSGRRIIPRGVKPTDGETAERERAQREAELTPGPGTTSRLMSRMAPSSGRLGAVEPEGKKQP
jgi:hypothetical protein